MFMELVQELLVTASLALVLSFFVAKLVSMILTGDAAHDAEEFKSRSFDEAISVDELRFGENLRVRGFERERKVECVHEAAERIHEFVGEPDKVDEIVEFVSCEEKYEEEECEFPENFPSGSSGKNSETVGLPNMISEGSSGMEESTSGSDLKGITESNIKDSMADNKESRKAETIGVKSTSHEVALTDTAESRGLESELKEKDEATDLGLDDDDDWEGIERSDLENVFAAATKFVDSMDKDDRFANVGGDLQMDLYGLHKVATEGPCREPQPMALKVSARAKWNAWQMLGNMNPDEAMEQYISILSDRVPGWMEVECYSAEQEHGKLETLEVGLSINPAPDTSTVIHIQPNSTSERELNPVAERGDVTGCLDLENKAKG